MSRWTVLRLLLIAIIGLWLAGPVLAQRPNPWRVTSAAEAPMPRSKQKHGELRLGIRFGGPQAVQMIYELRIDGEPAAAPMPRTAGSQEPCCNASLVPATVPEELLHFFAVPATPIQQACPYYGRAGGDVLFEQRVIPTGPMLLGANPVQSLPPCCEANHRAAAALGQPHPLTIHRLPSCNEINYSWTFQAPAAGVPQAVQCSDAKGWWLDSTPVPQPRHGIPVVVIPQVWDHRLLFNSPLVGECAVSDPGSALPSHPPVCCASAGKLSGTWHREVAGMTIAVTLAGDEMKVCTTMSDDGHTACVTLTADYAITKEGIVHGIVTGADVSGKSLLNGDGSPGDGPLEASAEFQKLVDCPFSFRTKVTSAGVMISNFKMAAGDLDKDQLALVCGLYKPAVDGKVPTPGTVKVRAISRCVDAPCQPPVAVEVVTRTIPDGVRVMPVPTAPGQVVPVKCDGHEQSGQSVQIPLHKTMTLPSARYLQHYPQYFPPDPIHPLSGEVEPTSNEKERVKQYYGGGSYPVGSVELCPQCPNSKPMPVPQSFSPPKPANVPAGDFGMMADVFGQMVCAPAAPPCQVQPASLTTVVSRPVPAPPMPVPTVRAMPIVGTWVREVGPIVYVLKIAGDHFTISATAAAEFAKGQVMTQGMVLTADYQLLRDGATLVGVVSGVDTILEGDLSAINGDPMPAELLDQIQKMLSDKPLAMSLRVYGDTLMVGNVRMTDGPIAGGSFPMGALGGRYKSIGEKGIPKPKVTKVNDLPHCPPVSQMPPPYPVVNGPVPSGAYLPAPVVGGVLTTEYSNSPFPVANPPLNPYGPPGPAIGLPPQPMQYPPPPVESPRIKPSKKKPIPTAPVPIGTR